jgi:hypothetical protein
VLSKKLKPKNKNIMKHRIILSTDLLIAVRDKSNKAKELKAKPSVEGIIISQKNYAKHIVPINNDLNFALYGHEHAEAV